MSGRQPALRPVVTAEHGGNRVPDALAPLFQGRGDLLASHRGWDPGTADLAAILADALEAPSFVATVTRLVVDLNRSERNPAVFSEITRALAPDRREGLLEAFHRPHRQSVADHVAGEIQEGRDVLHLGVHSFTPVLAGRVRQADLALLYDPGRPAERALVDGWVRGLKARLPDLRVRRNDPYRGTSDGLTTALRKRFSDPRYLGIEIEVNQRLLGPDGRFPRRIAEALVAALPEA